MAEGYILEIPENVLKQLDQTDKKIETLAKTSESTKKLMKSAFQEMADGLNPLLQQLKTANKGIKDLMPKLDTSGTEKVAKSVANVAEQLNRVSQSPVDVINKKIESLKNLLNDSTSAVSKLDSQIANLKNKGGGFISGSTMKEASAGKSLTPQIQAELAVLEQERRSILATASSWENYKKTIGNTSIALDQLNSSFKTGSSALQQQQKMMDAAFEKAYKMAQAEEKAAAEAEKLAKAQEKLNREQNRKSDQQAAQAMQAYNRAMAASEGTIAQRINKLAKLRSAQEQLNATGKNYAVQLQRITVETQRLNAVNDATANSMNNLKKNQGRILDTSAQLERKLGLLFSVAAIEGYIGKLVQVRGEFELQNRALQAILQNKDQADQLFNQVVELAVRSPYRVKELVTYTKQLAAYRIETEKLYDTTKMLADISSGLGVEMDRLILAFGQVKAANYLRGTELRQFSEAGINILGELATYFTELEGRMVSVGEVFDMVSNRMVAFEDVEEVFKRITSAGGIFYNMQEIQAETLQGQISNLQDSFDVMFNEIGKANDGVLKDLVAIVRGIVESWEVFAVLLKSVATGFVLYTGKIVLATIANKAFAASQGEIIANSGRVNKAIGGTVTGLKNLLSFAKGNPYLLIATGIATAIYAATEYNSKIEEAKAKYDILTNSLARQKNEIDSISSKIKEYNAKIKESAAAMQQFKEGTKEYTDAQKENNESSAKRNALLEELRINHPTVYNSIITQKDGTVDLTKAQEEFNKKLEQTNYLNWLAKRQESWFSTGMIERAAKLSELQAEYNKQANSMGNIWLDANGKLNVFLQTAKNLDPDVRQQIVAIQNSAGTAVEKLKALDVLGRKTAATGGGGLRELMRPYSSDFNDYDKALSKLTKTRTEMSEDIKKLATDFKKTYNIATEEGRKAAQETLRDYINSLNIADEETKKFVSQEFTVKFGVEIASKPIINQYQGMQARLKKYVEDHKLELDIIKPDQGTKDYFDKLKAELKDSQSNVEKLNVATEQLNASMTNEEALKYNKERVKQLTQILTAFGEMPKSNKGENERNKVLQQQIDLLKKVGQEYQKNLKYYSKAEALEKTRKDYTDSFKEAGLGNLITTMNFDPSGIIAGLESLMSSVSPKMRLTLEKAIADLKGDVEIEVRAKDVERTRKEIEGLFTGYELTVELGKLGLDKDLISQLFGIDTFTLDDIKAKLKSLYPDIKALSEEQLKAYNEASDKITAAEKASLQERLKDYSQYLKKSMSERIKIELEAQKKIAEIPSEFTKPQKEQIKKNIQKETRQKLDKQSFAEFKESDLYITMFEDLDRVSSSVLEQMKAKLISLKESLKDLSPTELKEITSQMQKIDEQIEKRNPFKELLPNIKEYISYLKEKKNLEAEYTDESKTLEQYKQQQTLAENNVLSAQKQYDVAVKKYGLNSKEANLAKENLRIAQQALDIANNNVKSQGEVVKALIKQIKYGETLKDKLQAVLLLIGRYADEVGQTISDVATSMENVFGEMDAKAADSIGSLQEILSGVGDTAAGVARVMANPADIGGYLQGITGLAKTIGAFFNIGDKKKERQIQREIEKIENLDKAYKKLEKSIEAAYSVDTFQESNRLAQENVKAQIKAYEQMIAAEDAKKKTDKKRIKEWQGEIEKLHDLQLQLKEEALAEMGGFGTDENFKSAAQEFANAWYEAFKETGDGMKGLETTFQEFMDNIVKKQLLVRGTQKILEPLLKMIDNAVEDSILTKEELSGIMDKFNTDTKGALDALYKSIVEGLGVIPGVNNQELSGLNAGIKGITEETAQALEALLNSMRFFVADSNVQLKTLSAIGSFDVEANPLLGELVAQTRVLRDINSKLESVITAGGNNSVGGYSIKTVL